MIAKYVMMVGGRSFLDSLSHGSYFRENSLCSRTNLVYIKKVSAELSEVNYFPKLLNAAAQIFEVRRLLERSSRRTKGFNKRKVR